jgi:hypothetical protein
MIMQSGESLEQPQSALNYKQQIDLNGEKTKQFAHNMVCKQSLIVIMRHYQKMPRVHFIYIYSWFKTMP